MAWDFVSVSTYVEVSSGDITLNAPAGIQEGDLLVACIAYRDSAAFTLPANWNLVATQQSSGDTDATQGIASGVMAWIVRGASNPSFTFTRTGGNVAQGTVLAYRGHIASPYDTGGAATLGTIGEPSLAAISTAQAQELLVAMVSSGDNSLMTAFDAVTSPNVASGNTDTSTEPTSDTWIERFDRGSNTGADTGLAVADAIKPNSGSTGTLSADAETTTRSVFIVAAFKQQFTYSMTGSGGALGGGSATVTQQKTKSVTMDGGGLAGGSATVVQARTLSMAGGSLAGGSATLAFEKTLVMTMAGGGLGGGAATVTSTHTVSVTMAGGGIVGGAADYSFHVSIQSYPMTMSGGGLGGGVAGFASGKGYAMAGGALAGGSATVALQKSLSLSMAGGGVSGGAAGFADGSAYEMDGGGICGGESPAIFGEIVELFLSGHIPAGGSAPTTFRLTAPAGKSGSDFAAGFISDDTNPVPSIDLGSGQFTELEWSLQVSDIAGMGDEFEFRVTDNGAVLSSYIQTPKATVAVLQSLEVTMQGGAIAGGACGSVVSAVVAFSGGAVVGGSADIALQQSFSVAMAGGGISGGAAAQIQSLVAAGAGGAVVGGEAGQSKGAILSMAGGALAGGTAPYSTSAGVIVIMEGGAVTGGAAGLLRGAMYVIQGGAVAGGVAGCEGTLGRSIITRVRKSGGGVIPLREPDEGALREQIEREYEERLIMATIKMFLESQDKWAA